MNEIADSSRSFESPYLRQAGPGKTIYIVIAGDRGLAGGYNNNVLKLAFRQMPQDAVVLPIGKKTVEFFQHRSCEILTESIARRRPSPLATVIALQSSSQTGFWTKTYQNVVLVYTNFVSLLAQTPAALPLLPLTISAEKQTNAQRAMIYEGGSEAVFNAIVPEYLGGVLYWRAVRVYRLRSRRRGAWRWTPPAKTPTRSSKTSISSTTGPARARLRRRSRKLSLAARTDHSGTRGVHPI